MSRNGDVNCPPRLYDSAPLDYFLKSIPNLKDDIISLTGEIELQWKKSKRLYVNVICILIMKVV